MKRKKNILLFLLIISTLCLILLPNFVKGSIADIHYKFENDNLYSYVDDSEIFVNKLSNAKNSSEYTKTYDASYSFTNDINGNNPLYFNSDESGGSIEVNASIDNHDKVVEYIDDGNDLLVELDYEPIAEVSGTYEFWIQYGQTDKDLFYYILDDDTSNAINIHISNAGQIRYYDGAWHVITTYVSNKWYHIRIDFECGAGAYLGLGADTFFITINGVQFGAYGFRGNPTTMDIIRWRSKSFDSGILYLDAIGYSWLSNYTIGQNFIPFLDIDTSIQEVDRWEFAYSSFEVLYSVGTSIFSDWSELNDPHNEVQIKGNPDWTNDRVINMDHNAPETHDLGIEREFTETYSIINITYGLEFNNLDGLNRYETHIYSSDSTEILEVYFAKGVNIELIIIDDGGAELLINTLAINEYYQLNLYINYNDELCVLILYIDGVYENTYYFGLQVSGKSGLSKIETYLDINVGSDSDVDLDYIGVFVNNIAISTEFAHLRINELVSPTTLWLFNEYNLVSFNMTGNSSIWISESPYLGVVSLIVEIAENKIYNEINTVNVYDNPEFGIPPSEQDPIIWFQFYGQFSLNSLSIDGVKLHQDINEYPLEFSYNNVDINESYFYVDLDNKLQFILITNDTNTEYIQATFDIPNIDSTDRAISFRGFRKNLAYGYFIVDYIAGLSTVEIPIIEKTTRAILPSNNTIDNFIILISDNDIDIILGITTGYVSQFILLNVLGLGLPIVTAGLIEMMIPLLLIIVPTLLISKGFGKEGKKLLIPLFLVFSLIATATFIIPVWIFFIIAFGISLFLFRNKEIESEI